MFLLIFTAQYSSPYHMKSSTTSELLPMMMILTQLSFSFIKSLLLEFGRDRPHGWWDIVKKPVGVWRPPWCVLCFVPIARKIILRVLAVASLRGGVSLSLPFLIYSWLLHRGVSLWHPLSPILWKFDCSVSGGAIVIDGAAALIRWGRRVHSL